MRRTLPSNVRRTLQNSLPLLLISAAALAQPAADPGAARRQIEDAERARAADLAAQQEAAARAQAAAAEEKRLADARVAAAARLRQAEEATADVAVRIDALSRRRADAQKRLDVRAAELEPLLPLIERLSLYPAETLLALPASPDDALRGVLVLRGIAHQLEQEAIELRREQAAVDAIAAQIAAENPRLAAAQARQAAEEADLDRQVVAAQQARRGAEDAAAGAASRAAEDAARADSLRAAIAGIEARQHEAEARARDDAARAERQKHAAEAAEARGREQALARPAGPGLDAPHGQLTTPIAGSVVRNWGETTDAGPATGVSFQGPPGARVVSPCGGKVVFAGPFRSYGLLLIVDCGGGYHFVLAGLDRLDVQVGRPVQAGEPVGVMPGWDPHVPGNRPSLYVELRHEGQAVNPAPFLKARL
jgi:septal ring factor EnvC (AmiA/AmiB activator)